MVAVAPMVVAVAPMVVAVAPMVVAVAPMVVVVAPMVEAEAPMLVVVASIMVAEASVERVLESAGNFGSFHLLITPTERFGVRIEIRCHAGAVREFAI
jgi:hypothetical protein